VFKLTKKNLASLVIFPCLALILSIVVPQFRSPVLNILKFPLVMVSAVKGELTALVFYHRNSAGYARIKKEADYLKNKLNELDEVYLENRRLKGLLSFKNTAPHKVVAAKIIGRSADNWSSVVIIDKGSSRGIRRDMPVVSFLGLVGRVTETAAGTSKVMLINDPGLAISAVVGRSRQEGLIRGSLGKNLVMRYLPQDADIQVTDKIVTSGLNGTWPKGIIIGRVEEINAEFSGLSKYAIIKPSVDLSALEEVLVIVG